jgi:predicted ribosomally synthesized six-cysteine peptide SCIFF
LQFIEKCIIIGIQILKLQEVAIMIKTIAKPAEKKVTACGECRSTCQSACKTSCTVGNQSCERITREEKIERK